MTFQKAEKKGIRGRIALVGPAGSGKTYTALELAQRLGKAYDTTVAVIDSEQGSAKKYADAFDFSVVELHDDFAPQKYIDAMTAAEEAGFGVLVIDSLTHAWVGAGGVLDKHGDATAKQKSGNSYVAWREVTPLHNALVDAMLAFKGHLIVTIRAKTEYDVQKEDGRTKITKVGLAPVQREGLDYEFDIVGDVDMSHRTVIGKTRCAAIVDKVFKPTPADMQKFAASLIEWFGDQADIGDNGSDPTESGNVTWPKGVKGREDCLNRLTLGLQKRFNDSADAHQYVLVETDKDTIEDLADDELAAFTVKFGADYTAWQKEQKDAS